MIDTKQEHLLHILKILKEDSDHDHILKQSLIREKLKTAGHSISRPTFYDAVYTLIGFGFDISTYSENHAGYFLRTHENAQSEITFLCKAVEESDQLSYDEQIELKKTLLSVLSKPMQKELLCILAGHTQKRDQKTETLRNLDMLRKAIYQQKQISFRYFHYNEKKEKEYNPKPFSDVEPRFLINNDSKNYLITSGGRHNSVSCYRVDRMSDIEIMEISVTEGFKYQNAYEFAMRTIYMFTEEPILVQLRCSRHVPHIYDKMIDEFGAEAEFRSIDDDWFDIITKCTPTGLLFLAQKYIDAFIIISPDWLNQEMQRRIATASQQYHQHQISNRFGGITTGDNF